MYYEDKTFDNSQLIAGCNNDGCCQCIRRRCSRRRLAASNVTEDPIEEVSVDDVIEEIEDSESLSDVSPEDFNVQINSFVNMSDDEDDVAIKYTLPEDVNGYLLFYVNESLAANTFSISEPGNYSLTLTNLSIDERGEYYIEVQYLKHVC